MKQTYGATIRLALGVIFCAACATVQAQGYPTKAVRMIVPFPPGGAADVIARLLTKELAEEWRQPVYIENHGGAGSLIGTALVAKAAPDGYTLLLTTSALVTAPSVYSKPGFDPLRDFAPISIVASTFAVLVVHPSFPARTVEELIALAKANPGKFSFASSGTGTPIHLAFELFREKAGIDLVHIPYNGGGPADIALLGGQVPMMFESPLTALRYAESGRMRALGVSSARRSSVAPQIPTLAESGVPGYEASFWFAVLAPAGTPGEIVAKINRDLVKLINKPDIRQRIVGLGADVIGNTAEEAAAIMKSDVPKWARIAEISHAKVE
jgi:tripartite-type tricarboxylate transporter receptor subunit TctC